MKHFDHLVYLRVHEGCNLWCEHCYIPANPKRMGLDNIATVPKTIAAFAKTGDHVRLQWHGGEPTLVGAAWMREAIEIIEANTDYRWSHDIQTNLMNYSPEWAALFHEHFDSHIGVSWDPVIRMSRKSEDGNARYENGFRVNLAQAVADGLAVSMTITATKPFFERFRNPLQLFALLEDMGVMEAHIERLTKVGRARETWDAIGVRHAEYSHGMSRILRAYQAYLRAGGRVRISPFDSMVEAFISSDAGLGCWSGACDSRFHTIDANGYKSGCTALTSEYDNTRSKANVIRIENIGRARDAHRVNCAACNFKAVCSSGCLALEVEDGSGECSGASRLLGTAQNIANLQAKEMGV